jgi:phage terminase Nu1 subunit (DNA packaging protein)
MKTILHHAIEIEGTQRKLAAAIGVDFRTVSLWGKRGLPKGREQQLIRLYGRRKLKTWTGGATTTKENHA